MKKSNSVRHVNARPNGEILPNPNVSCQLIKNHGVPTEIGVDVESHRLDLALKLADAVQSIAKLSLQACNSVGVGHARKRGQLTRLR